MKLTSNLKEYIEGKCYTKAEIDEAIGNITQFDYQMVDELPSTGVKGTIYMLQNNNNDSDNLFDGYLFVNNRWELVGPRIDLSNYYTREEVNNIISSKVSFSDEVTSNKNGVMSSSMKNKLDNIDEEANKTVVTPIATIDGKRTKIATINNIDIFVPVDDELSDSSSNPIQNKILDVVLRNFQTEINRKAEESHTHTKQDIVNLMNVTSTTDGLMSKEDKIKLEGIEVEANKTIIDNSINNSSTNPVANKVINSALSNLQNMIDRKSDTGHTHSKNEITGLDDSSLINLMDDGVFVSSNGSDTTGNGTFSNPYKTIQKGLSTVSEDGVVYVFGGNYNESFSPYSSCSIIGLGEVNIFMKQYPITVFGEDTSLLKLKNLNFLGLENLQSGYNSLIMIFDGKGEVVIENCRFENINKPIIASYNRGTNYIVRISNSVFKNNEVSVSDGALIKWPKTVDINNCKFIQNTVPKGVSNSIVVGDSSGTNININNTIFEQNNADIFNDYLVTSSGVFNLSINNCILLNNDSSYSFKLIKGTQVRCMDSLFIGGTNSYSAFYCNAKMELYHNVFIDITGTYAVLNSGAQLNLIMIGNIVQSNSAPTLFQINSNSVIRSGNIVNGEADYDSVATSTKNGLMSNSDKTKIDDMQTIPMVVTFDDDTTATYNLYKSG